MRRGLSELIVVLAAIIGTSIHGEHIGRHEAQRAGQGVATASITAGIILAAYKVYRGKDDYR